MADLPSYSAPPPERWHAPPLAITTPVDPVPAPVIRLAATLEIPLLTAAHPPPPLLLVHTGARLELHDTTSGDGPVFVDFVAGKAGFRRRHSGKKQPLARAVGIRGENTIHVLDATPGLGADTFVLAALGCRVRMVERSPVMAALLRDGLERAAADPGVAHIIDQRLTLTEADARTFLESNASAPPPEVIYLDPMYPHRTKSALVKKEMRRLRTLLGDDDDAPALLETALRHAGNRVVVKRPRLAPPLGGKKADWSIVGKSTRFDVHLVNKNKKIHHSVKGTARTPSTSRSTPRPT